MLIWESGAFYDVKELNLKVDNSSSTALHS